MPDLDPVRLAAHAHAHVAWFATAALVHPALRLRRAGGTRGWSVGLAVARATLGAGLGVVVYGRFRDRVRHELFVTAPSWGWMFERKEHLSSAGLISTLVTAYRAL